MANNDVVVNIKVNSDTAGTQKAEKALDDLRKKSENSAKSFIGGFADAKKAAENFKTVIESVSQIGFLKNSFDAIVGVIDKLTSSQEKAKEEAIALAEAERDAANAEGINKLTEAYRNLSAQMAEANTQRQQANELEDMQRSANDKLEDDTAKLKMMEDVAALDKNDPLYEQKKEQITAKYEADNLRKSVSRQKRDLNIAEDRLYQEQESTINEADMKDFSLMDDRARLADLKKQAAELRAASSQENEFDNNTSFKQFMSNLKAIFTLNGERFDNSRTEKGDELRKKQEEKANELEQKAKEQEEIIAAKEKEIAQLRSKADYIGKKAAITGDMASNLNVSESIADMNAGTMVNNANTAASESAAKISDATAAKKLLTVQRDELKRKIAAEQQKKDDAARSVYNAESNLQGAQLSGSNVSGAYNQLQEAKNAAQNVNSAADEAITALTKTLQSVEQRLKAAQNFLQSQSKQNAAAWAESPAGQ